MSSHSQAPPARIKWGPEELAVRWGVPISRVLHWILTGQLRAVDASERPGGDPDYRVDIVDLAMFEQEREIHSGNVKKPHIELPHQSKLIDAAIDATEVDEA